MPGLGTWNLERGGDADFAVQTQKFNSGHQVLGLVAVAMLIILFIVGLALYFKRRATARRNPGERPQPPKGPLVQVQTGGSWLLWLVLLVNAGL